MLKETPNRLLLFPVSMHDAPSASAPKMIYGLEDRLPIGTALLVSFQQVVAMVVGTITPTLILAGVLKFPPADTAYLISAALLASAFGTFIQTKRRGIVGSGLLSVTGTSFAFLGPLMLAGQAGGLPLMFGLSLAAAPMQVVFAPFLPRLQRVFPPIVCGIVVLLIGLSLIPSGMYGIAAPAAPGAPAWAGLVIALVVLAVILSAQATGKRWARLGSVPLGIVAGYATCAACGWLQPAAPGDGSWIVLPRWLPHGLAFDAALLVPFAFIYLVSLLESLGDMTATAQLSGLPTSGADHWKRLRGGILADGLTSVFAGLTGAFPSTTYAQNNGVIQITGVASRRIGPIMAAMLAALALFPPVGRWITAMPGAVLGALSLMLFGVVAVAGIRLIQRAGLSQRNVLITAFALAAGLGLPSQPELLKSLPHLLSTLLESGASAGGITALALNLILPEESVA